MLCPAAGGGASRGAVAIGGPDLGCVADQRARAGGSFACLLHGVVAGETEEENIKVNAGMLRDLLAALWGRGIAHVALMTGLKHYLGPFEAYEAGEMADTPFHEEEPRLRVRNFTTRRKKTLGRCGGPRVHVVCAPRAHGDRARDRQRRRPVLHVRRMGLLSNAGEPAFAGIVVVPARRCSARFVRLCAAGRARRQQRRSRTWRGWRLGLFLVDQVIQMRMGQRSKPITLQ